MSRRHGISPAFAAFRVALTFDAEHADRPTRPGVTDAILDVLTSGGVPASFFIQGRWAEAYPGTAARIGADGHLVGSHSFYHARLPLLTRGGLAADVAAAERVISQTTGVDPRPWFRCPFGSGAHHPLVLRRLAALGYRDVGWDVDSRDWAVPVTLHAAGARRLVSRVVRLTVARGDGAVLLMHGWPVATAEALPEIVAGLADAGARFVRLDELRQSGARVADVPRLGATESVAVAVAAAGVE